MFSGKLFAVLLAVAAVGVAGLPARPAPGRRSPTEFGGGSGNVARSPYVIMVKDANPKFPTELVVDNGIAFRSPARPAPGRRFPAEFWGENGNVARSPARPAPERRSPARPAPGRRSPTEFGGENENVARSPVRPGDT